MMNAIYRFFLRWPAGLLTAVAVATLLILTLMPGDEMPQAMPIAHLDKAAHALMFGLVSCAAMMDIGRACGRISLRMILTVAAVATALGAGIEWLQETMAMGRSGDPVDLVADAVGALCLPLLCLPLLKDYVKLSECSLSSPAAEKIPFEEVKRIYMASFPEEERRPWEDLTAKITDPSHPLNIVIISHRGRPAGFITCWQLDGVRYVEHFAIDSALRGRSIGSRAIRAFCNEKDADPVVLEVEPTETGTEAQRRIRFYERCGFTAHHSFPYIQPPYAPGLPEVRLTLMTCGTPGHDLDAVAKMLHQQVYGAD